MAIPFDHTQKALDANLIAGNASTVVKRGAGSYTDEEVWRSWVNPGMSGTFDFIEATMRFNAYLSGGDLTAVVSWRWQIRPEGQSTWSDLHSAVASTFTGANVAYEKHLVFDASSPSAEDAPFELRLVFSTTDTDDTLTFTFFAATASASVLRVVGESL